MKFKKITVVKSNNELLNYDALERYNHDSNLEDLKEYVEKFISLEIDKDYEVALRVLKWVSHQWTHDGMNDAKGLSSLEILKEAHGGMRFRCVEYGKVTADILKSLGIISRSVGLKTSDAAYGGLGRGHVASEIWSNELSKWIFVDPQFSVYIESDGQLLNFIEMYRLVKANTFDLRNIVADEEIAKKSNMTMDQFKKNYVNFITNYTGSIDTSINSSKNIAHMVLLLDCEKEILTFQGMPGQAFVPTRSIEQFYIEPNRTSLSFEFTEKLDFMKIIKERDIVDEESFLNNMHYLAAKPNFLIKCSHNMPNFSHFEYSCNNQSWNIIEGSDFNLSLTKARNQLNVRAVNKRGLKGVLTVVEIDYV